jgi:hypothetical protein
MWRCGVKKWLGRQSRRPYVVGFPVLRSWETAVTSGRAAMVGRPSPQNQSISRLTSLPETILSHVRLPVRQQNLDFREGCGVGRPPIRLERMDVAPVTALDRMLNGGRAPLGRAPRRDRACLRLLRQTSMKRTFRLTFGRRAVSCRVKLLKFGLKFLVDEQQGFHCANHVAATGGYNRIDNSVGTI